MKTRHSPSIVIAGLAIAVTLASCGSRQSEKITIAWLVMSLGTPDYFAQGESGAAFAASDLSAATDKNVEAMIIDSPGQDASLQARAMQGAIAAKVQAIAVDVVDATTLSPIIQQATNAGIPVLTFENDAPDSSRLGYYGMDNAKASQTAFQLLANLMGDSGEFALWDSSTLDAVFTSREQGFQAELARHPNVTLAATYSCGAPEQTETVNCTTPLDGVLAAHPNITGWYFMRGKAIWEADLDKKAPRWAAAVKAGTIKVVGFDPVQNAVSNMQAGYVQALIGQKHFGWGYDLVTIAYDIISSKRRVATWIDSGFDVVCANNLAQFAALTKSKDFRTLIDPCSSLPP